MSRSSEIVISASRGTLEPGEAIPRLIAMTGATKLFIASRTVGPSHSFDRLKAYAKGEVADLDEGRVRLGYDIPAGEAATLYREGTCLMMDLSVCPLLESLDAAVLEHVPAAELGEFGLARVYLKVGDHDVFDIDHDDKATLLGRYFLSISFLADGVPTRPDAVRRRILALDEFQHAHARFEQEFGASEVAFLSLL